MDVKILFMPLFIQDFFMFVGILWTCQAVLWIIQNLLSLYYHKESYKNPKDLRYFLILEENKKLKTQLQKLEDENNQIISSIINKFDK